LGHIIAPRRGAIIKKEYLVARSCVNGYNIDVARSYRNNSKLLGETNDYL